MNKTYLTMQIRKLLLALLFLPLCALGQKTDMSKYLAGAVPQNEQGVVFFQRSYDCPGQSRAQTFQKLKTFLQDSILHGANALPQSRLVESDSVSGLLAARVEETLYFKRKAWVTHSTRFFYELIYNVSDDGFSVEMRHLRYLYDEFQNAGHEPLAMPAEEWITDKEALNSKGGLVKRTRYFRICTIDRKDDIFRQSARAAGAKPKTRLIEVEE